MTADPAPADAVRAGRELVRELVSELVSELSSELGTDRPISIGRFFNGEGVSVGGSYFAFVSRAGRLVVKLPVPEVERLVSAGTSERMTMGTRTMREWVATEQGNSDAATRDLWRPLLVAAYNFVGLSPASRRARS